MMAIRGRSARVTFYIPELSDLRAVTRLDTLLRSLDEVAEFTIDRHRQLVGITFSPDRISQGSLREHIRTNGFKSVRDT